MADTDSSREKARETARRLVALAKGNANKNEARNAQLQVGRIVIEHDLLAEPEKPSAPPVTIVDVVERVRETASDPKVQSTVSNLADIFAKGAEIASYFRKK